MNRTCKILAVSIFLLPLTNVAKPGRLGGRNILLGSWGIGLTSFVAGGILTGLKTNQSMKKWDYLLDKNQDRRLIHQNRLKRRTTSIRNGIIGGVIAGVLGFLTAGVCSIGFKL